MMAGRRRRVLLAAVLLGWALAAAREPWARSEGSDVGRKAEEAIRVQGLEGSWVEPLPAGRTGLTAIVFVSVDCPISNRYAPEYRRLGVWLAERKIPFWLVHSGDASSLEAIRKHAREYELPGKVVRDRAGALARRVGATVTPEAALVDARGELVYRGRLNDRFPALGQQRVRAGREDFREAIEAVLAGKPVAVARTEAVGCFIEIPAAAR